MRSKFHCVQELLLNHAPIGEYRRKFITNRDHSCPYGMSDLASTSRQRIRWLSSIWSVPQRQPSCVRMDQQHVIGRVSCALCRFVCNQLWVILVALYIVHCTLQHLGKSGEVWGTKFRPGISAWNIGGSRHKAQHHSNMITWPSAWLWVTTCVWHMTQNGNSIQ